MRCSHQVNPQLNLQAICSWIHNLPLFEPYRPKYEMHYHNKSDPAMVLTCRRGDDVNYG